MVYLQLLFSVLYPTVLGVCFVNIFLNKNEDAALLERIALGFCMGLMLITAEMFFVLSSFNIRFSVAAISLPLVPFIIWGGIITIKNKLIDFRFPDLTKFSFLEKLLVALIMIQILFVTTSSLIKPVSGWDAWQRYSLRAKASFIEGTSNLVSLLPETRGQHVPLIQTWVFECIGQWNEIIGKANFPLLYISLLVIFYYAARRTRSRLIALLCTYILSSLPFLVYHATLEYCDFSLAVYLFGGVSLLFLWFNKYEPRYLLLALIFLLSTITIKNESLFHLSMVALVFAYTIFSKRFGAARDIKNIRVATIILMITGAAYLIKEVFFSSHEAIKFASVLAFTKISPLLSVFCDYSFIRSNWSLLFPVLIVLLIFNNKKLKENYNSSLLGLVILEVFGLMAYYFTQEDIYTWLFFVTPAVRNMLQFIPIAVLLVSNLTTLDIPATPEINQSKKINTRYTR